MAEMTKEKTKAEETLEMLKTTSDLLAVGMFQGQHGHLVALCREFIKALVENIEKENPGLVATKPEETNAEPVAA